MNPSRLALIPPLLLTLCCPLSSNGPDCLADTGPIGPLVKVRSGFAFVEGPASDRHGNLYFSDMKDGPGRIYRLDTAGRLELIVADSGRANGLAINAQGEIVACQSHTGKVVAFASDGSAYRVIAAEYHCRRFNAPNDLVIDHEGGIYFTDPCFDEPTLFPPQKVLGVYYISPTGEVTRLIDHLAGPNGIDLSPDEKTLYVVPSLDPHVMAYPIEAPGKLGLGHVHALMAWSPNPFYPGGDGMTIDAHGNMYVTSQRGVQIFNACGHRLGIIHVPERPANVEFGGPDRKTLYITAKHSLYAVPMAVSGK
jgi:gluconolactonase